MSRRSSQDGAPTSRNRVEGNPDNDSSRSADHFDRDAGPTGVLFIDEQSEPGPAEFIGATLVGHKTESTYCRYAIVDEKMRREAAAKLDVWNAEQRLKAEAERKGQFRRFKKRQPAHA